MNSRKLSLSFAFILSLIIVFLPFIADAQFRISGPGRIENPLSGSGGSATLEEFMVSLLRIVFLIGTVVVVFFIVLAGFKYVMAQGNPKEIETANRMLLYCVIGAVILLGAETIAKVIKDTVTQLGA